ncbi:hypothetical protein AB0H98_26160 [Nocardia salmonicida]|uniref:hypothetical protein n=1 Tax=Nocardia salmonicida TaxID=53431 RepID=UPI0033C120C8
MEGKEWLSFAGPIAVAVVTATAAIATPYFITRLGSRDKRAQIRADLELLDLVPADLYGHEVLRSSIDRRVRSLAQLSLPREWQSLRFHNRQRRFETIGMYGALLVAVIEYFRAWMSESSTQTRVIHGVVAVIACGLAFWLQRRRDNLDVVQSELLLDEEIRHLERRHRVLTAENDALLAERDALTGIVERAEAVVAQLPPNESVSEPGGLGQSHSQSAGSSTG